MSLQNFSIDVDGNLVPYGWSGVWKAIVYAIKRVKTKKLIFNFIWDNECELKAEHQE